MEGGWRNILVVKRVKKEKLKAESTNNSEEKKKIEEEEEAKTRTTARMHVKVTDIIVL